MIRPIRLLNKALSMFSGRHSPEFMNELESNIQFVQDPFGDPAHSMRAKQALQFLLERADEAYPRLLELITSNRASNPLALIEALPRFGRAESIPVLEEILIRGQGISTGAASLALARHQQDAACEALVRALGSSNSESVAAAADGLMSRGDQTVCSKLVQYLNHRDSIARYHIVQAACHLGCLSHKILERIASDDSDKDIRTLASRAQPNRPSR